MRYANFSLFFFGFVQKKWKTGHCIKKKSYICMVNNAGMMLLKRFLTVLFSIVASVGLHAQGHYTFDEGQLGPEWRFLGRPDSASYRFVGGKLRLRGSIYDLHENRGGTFAALEAIADTFTVDTKLTLFDADNGDEAGLCAYGSPQCFVQCCLNNYVGSRRLKVRLQLLSHRLLLADRSVGTLSDVWLRIRSTREKLKFFYSVDGKRYHWLEDVERRLLAPDITGSDSPMLVGMYAYMGSTKYQSGFIFGDFDFFDFTTHP